MKRLILAIAILFGCAPVAWAAAAPAPLTTLRAVRALTNAEASQRLPATFEGTVTYFRRSEHHLFVQEGDLAVFVRATTDANIVPGDRVLVKGTTQESYRPIVVSHDVTVLHHGALPEALRANFSDLILGEHDGMLVKMHAVVRSADLVTDLFTAPETGQKSTFRCTTLELVTDGGYIEATVDSEDASALNGLLDAEVEITGVAGGKFDGKMQQTGIMLHVSTYADIKILKRASTDAWSQPATPMNQILAGYRVSDFTSRVKVQGTITYYEPGSVVVLEGGGRSLWIKTTADIPLRIGDLADATGFPDVDDGFLTLTHGEIKDSLVSAPIAPLPATWRQLAVGGDLGTGRHYDLVSIEGEVVAQAREGAQDEYILVADGHPFSAIYPHPNGPLPEMRKIPLGSKVRVTGICTVHRADPFNGTVPFDILLRSFDDITVVEGPSLLNIGNLTLIVGILLILVVAALARGRTLERTVHQKTAALAGSVESEAALERRSAQLEQMRNHILENINASHPMAEVIEQIAELVSFKLNGAPCWCQITDGALLGNFPPELGSLRVIHHEIPARTGPPLGTLFAAFDPHTKPSANEPEALLAAAELAMLAMETRHLYSDLLHHSEFDLLTDIHNRFSLEERLDTQIEEARQTAGIFGLIYIDLDEFKQVNDIYGHRLGDLYLQEVAARMKQQLRSHDLLARMGGDEFAALLPKVRNRADVEEIARRLEDCFDEPFAVEGKILLGSASLGLVLYPEDGTTKDSLLSAAGAAMHAAKHAKQQTPDGQQNPELTPDERA